MFKPNDNTPFISLDDSVSKQAKVVDSFAPKNRILHKMPWAVDQHKKPKQMFKHNFKLPNYNPQKRKVFKRKDHALNLSEKYHSDQHRAETVEPPMNSTRDDERHHLPSQGALS